jgi:hypothetical protein
MDLVEQCLAAEFKFESVLQARFAVLKGMGAEATSVQVVTYSRSKYCRTDSCHGICLCTVYHYITLRTVALQYSKYMVFFSPLDQS